jgi:hypothetical protein
MPADTPAQNLFLGPLMLECAVIVNDRRVSVTEPISRELWERAQTEPGLLEALKSRPRTRLAYSVLDEFPPTFTVSGETEPGAPWQLAAPRILGDEPAPAGEARP